MRTLFSEEQIANRIDELGKEIAAHFNGPFVLAPILTGGFIFGADLARAVFRAGGDATIDFVKLASYGDKQASSGIVKLEKDFSRDVTGKRVLLVDDVLDSGRSLFFATQMLREREAGEIRIAVAVDKRTGRAEPVEADFRAFEAGPDDFLVGYGMDDAGQKRGMPIIGAL